MVQGPKRVVFCPLEFKMTVIFSPGYCYAKNQFQQIWSNYTSLERKFKTNQFSYKKEGLKMNIF